MMWVQKRKGGTVGPFPLRYPLGWERLFSSHLGRDLGWRREHVHLDLAAAPGTERDEAVGGGEEGVVATDTDILARVHLGTALADQDVARHDLLAAEALHAEAASVGIAAVTRRAACFFMCHRTAPVALLGDDLFDLDHRQILTMTVLAPRILATALLEDDQVFAAALLHDRADNLGAGNGGLADLVAHHQDVGELDLGAGFALETLNGERVVGGDRVLFSRSEEHTSELQSL